MTYIEAVKAKKTIIPEYYMGFTWFIFIVPENSEDLDKYMKSVSGLFIKGILTDNHARAFSSDESFVLRGFCYTNGDILHRSININP